jgi:hypothetical protein
MRSSLPCMSHESNRRAVQFEECNRISRRARTCRQSILEYEPVSLHTIDEVERGVDALEKRDDLEVVSGSDDEVHRRRELSQGSLRGCDPFDRVRTTKQLVEEKEVSLARLARANDLDNSLDFIEVVALAQEQIIAPSDAAPDDQLWCFVSSGDTVFTVCPSTAARPRDRRNVDFPDMFEPVISTPCSGARSMELRTPSGSSG